MTDRLALLESALHSLPDGMALLDGEGGVVFWNHAAEELTGYGSADLLAKPVAEALQPLLEPASPGKLNSPPSRGALVHTRHKLGHDLPVMTRLLILRNAWGEQVGSAALFHPAERLDALPHGEVRDDEDVAANLTDVEQRLQSEFDDFARGGQSLGVLWIAVDQGAELRKTHGVAACGAMEEKMRRALATGLRPAEELGRWGDNEFLVIAHERTPEMLASHAQTLAGLARTADFRWWGDRLSLTVSIGAAQAEEGESLARLLKGAQAAMENSRREGGNRVRCAQQGLEQERPLAEISGGDKGGGA